MSLRGAKRRGNLLPNRRRHQNMSSRPNEVRGGIFAPNGCIADWQCVDSSTHIRSLGMTKLAMQCRNSTGDCHSPTGFAMTVVVVFWFHETLPLNSVRFWDDVGIVPYGAGIGRPQGSPLRGKPPLQWVNSQSYVILRSIATKNLK